MLIKHFLSILCLIFTICSCKCQDLEKFVAPILDNQKAPLVAIVDTTHISSHIVRSIEIPLREIINTTISCKINEELKEDIVSGKVLSDVKSQLETLQHKIDEHIGDNRAKLTDVKQDIASLRIDTEETISHEHDEILEQKKNMTKLVDTLKSDQDEKMKNLSCNVVHMQSEVQLKIDEHTRDSGDEFTVVKQDIASLRIDTEKTISHEILETKKYMIKLVDTLKSDQDEKIKNLTSNVVSMQSEVQKKVDEHIGDSREEFNLLKQYITTLRKEMEIVNTANKNRDEEVKNLTNNVEMIQSELRETILSVDNNASILVETLVKHSNRLAALHSNIQELTVNTGAIQNDMIKVRSTANNNNGLLGGLDSRLDDLNAKVNTISSRAQIHQQFANIEKKNLETENRYNLRFSHLQKQINDSTELVMFTAQGQFNSRVQGIIKFRYVKFSHGINNLTSYKSSGKFVVEKEGLYLISLLICSETQRARFVIYLNGVGISYIDIAYTKGLPTVIQRSSNVVLIRQLRLNDSIWVYFPDSCYIYGSSWSTFTILKVK